MEIKTSKIVTGRSVTKGGVKGTRSPSLNILKVQIGEIPEKFCEKRGKRVWSTPLSNIKDTPLTGKKKKGLSGISDIKEKM